MGTIAQLEADMIRERTRSGIKAAKQAGKHTGRPPFGFDLNDGYLTPNENYGDTHACIVLPSSCFR